MGRDRQSLTANAVRVPHVLPPLNRTVPPAEEEMPAEGSWIFISAYWEPLKRQEFVGWNVLRPGGPGWWWQPAQPVWWAQLSKIKLRPQLVMLADTQQSCEAPQTFLGMLSGLKIKFPKSKALKNQERKKHNDAECQACSSSHRVETLSSSIPKLRGQLAQRWPALV